ncbi:S41 family peptidase [Parabacteroides sp. PF5-6]|uniref:S41 family peptidase n=1 Tax=Parabacteroides sp. PF5-6 TaxID=1742403 RepID=UPI002407248E|nr:S41 family peptidase [Parabacteroides sp. PF5-6]MDF9830357.1 tricorn protease [Parabacteroides sp. PF5-6]
MKNLLSLFLFLAPFITYAQESLYFASQPVLSPDAQEIYFCFDGGIWRVPTDGGTAVRLTAMAGYQTDPKISPDGKWIAFSSDEQGNANVYIMPTAGGSVRQLTFHESADIVASWSPDSKRIYFESNRQNGRTTYQVGIDGGTPRRLFDGYFNTITQLVENPVDGSYYFVDSNEGYGSPTRKGYKGANNPDIKYWHPARKAYKEITSYAGKDIWPTVDSKGNLFWASDEKNGQYNLTTLENGKPRTLTNFKTAIHTPQVSRNGEKVVFTKDYRIQVYDVKTGKTTTPAIKAYENNRPDIAVSYNVEGQISRFDISPDGKKLAFVSRGKLFVADTKGLFIQPIRTEKKERVTDVKWAKDNQTLYYTRTRQGWNNLYKTTADKPSDEKSIYTPDQTLSSLHMSNDRSMIAFVTGSDKVELLYTEKDKVEKLADNEFWSFQSYAMNFSHDDKYLAYTAMNLFDRDVFVADLQTKKVTNLTNSATPESSPAWSLDGKYLYLTANRYSPSFPQGAQSRLYRIRLDYTDSPYVADQYHELFSTDTTKKVTPPITINTENIQRRWENVLPQAGQSNVEVFKSGEKEYLVYASNHEGSWATYVQERKDFDQQPAKKIADLRSPAFSYNGKNLYALQGGNLYSVDLAGASAKKIEIKHEFEQNNRNEFQQMFHEVWALIAANFYDPTFHGIDWKAKQTYYAQFLPHVKSRRDFRAMVNDMLGELNSSHLGFSSSGKEERKETAMRTMLTGVVFDNDSPYTVSAILKGSPADVVGQKILPGDVLTAVNGKKVDPQTNREQYFTSAAGEKEIRLSFSRGATAYDALLHTAPSYTLSNLYYTQWEDDCRERVSQKTNGRIAYHHMRDMGGEALNNFLIDMQTDAVHRDGLILDLRYNNGGNVHDQVLEYLSRKKHFTWKYRNKQDNTHPNHTPGDKPIVVLINERSLSDAEVTSNGIQSLGIAKLIGTETYRWIIFTSGAMLVDGSFCRLPGWGCYNLKGEDMEFAGVAPDIYVKNTFVDRLNGNDPQLDRAIEEILKELR